jgi:hypothetical protein
VLVGVVLMDGWPIAHHLFAGNRLDQTRVGEVVEDLRRRFGLQRVVLVGDRGMVPTLKNIELLREAEQGYLVGLQRRNRKDLPDYIEPAVARPDWQECPAGLTASEKSGVHSTRVQEVAGRQPGGARVGGAEPRTRAVRAGVARAFPWSGRASNRKPRGCE